MPQTDVSTRGMTRRHLLAGGLAGAGTVALAGCIADPDPPDAIPAGEVWVARVGKAPVDDPSSSAWQRTAPAKVVMDAQTIALPNRSTPAVPEITVRAVHDGSVVAFRLDWSDADVNDLTVGVDSFRDACAVLLAPGDADQTMRTMGTVAQKATLLHWKADWQRDLDQGVQGAGSMFPNRSIDVYPPLQVAVPLDVTPADYVAAGATPWLPGVHVKNPLSSITRTTCVEKLLAGGFGTAATGATQNCTGRGERGDGGWRVVLAKPMAAVDADEVSLAPGATATCAFALWSGSTNDAGGRKTPSKVAYRLTLEA